MTHPLILLPKHKEIIVGLRPVRMAGYYRMRRIRATDGAVRFDSGLIPNIITDIGLNRLGGFATAGSWATTCVVGTGTATPNVTDTSLQALLASTTTVQGDNEGNVTVSPRYGFRQLTYRFGAGAAAGNITEVGVGWASASLFSRALILDGDGNPTTLTILPDEFLDVTYELRFYVNEVDFTGTFSITGSGTHNYTERACQANTVEWRLPSRTFGWDSTAAGSNTMYSGTIGALTGLPSGTAGNASSVTNTAYSNNSLVRDRSATWGLNNGNVGNTRSIVFNRGSGSIGGRQVEFDPIIAKNSSRTFVIAWRTPWGRKII